MTAAEAKRDLSKRLHLQFTTAIGNRRYTPTPNTILDARIRNLELTIEERFDALLERTSMGNWSLFACKRDWDTGVATALTQGDFAEILGVDKRRISAVVGLRQKQGLVKINPAEQNGRLLALELDPVVEGRTVVDATALTWKAFSESWDQDHADLIKHKADMLAKAAPFLQAIAKIDGAKLSDFKRMRKEEKQPDATAPSDQAVLDFSDYESGTPATEVLDSLDDLSGTLPTETPAFLYIENSKQQQQGAEAESATHALSEDVVVVVEKLKDHGIDWVEKPAVQRILEDCRRAAPDCTAEVVAEVIARIGRTINRQTQKTPVGVLIKAVPLAIVDHRKTPAKTLVKLQGLQPMPRSEAITLLRRSEQDEDPAVRQYAKDQLLKLGEKVEGPT